MLPEPLPLHAKAPITMESDDPFHGLQDWAQSVEKRARRGHFWRRVAALPRRVASLPGRLLRALVRPARPGTIAMVVLLTLLGVVGWLNRDRLLNGESAAPAAYATQSHPAGIYATSTTTSRPTGPFENTPAATYPQGEAGLTMPAPSDVDGFSSAQVASALQQVRQALVAGRLDQRMLVDHDPSVFLALLAPNAAANLRGWFDRGTFMSVASQLAPMARLLPDPPRVSGRTTYLAGQTDTHQRYLEIVTNYVWVYPLQGPDRGPGSRLVIVHDEVHWRFYHSDDVYPADRGLQVDDVNSYFQAADCAEAEHGLLALWEGGPLPSTTLTTRPSITASPGRPEEYYDPNHSLDIADTCHR